ncbi:NADAR family protein [Alcaligenaceae bacterium SJ-26]|nr:NADAR family protein [Alcaligenaceae bacterium SJ-26]
MDDTQFLQALRKRFNAGEKLKYVFFWGHQQAKSGITASCFSQWYGAPFVVDGHRYASAEHFMMAEKARLFGDHENHARILTASNPGAAKALGRQVRGFDDATWLAQRFNIVVRANQAKFSQNKDLGDYLRQTGSRILVEASPVDRIWGIGMAQDDTHAGNPMLWRGLNLLGFALMQVREELGNRI